MKKLPQAKILEQRKIMHNALKVLALLLIHTLVANAEARPAGYLAEGTIWGTPVYVYDSHNPGPTVVVVGGVHGDEPAGSYAALGVANWEFQRGRVIVIPAASPTALLIGTRETPPDEGYGEVNLNRLFPIGHNVKPVHPLAADIWRLLTIVQPDWVIDLHEGERFFIKEPPDSDDKSVGQTIIVPRGTLAEPMAALMVRAVNKTINDPTEQYLLIGFGRTSRGQLARAAAEHLGANAMICETVVTDGQIDHRAANHYAMLDEFFRVLDMK